MPEAPASWASRFISPVSMSRPWMTRSTIRRAYRALAGGREARDRRAVEDVPVPLVETRAVARAVPALLGRIPGDDAAQVRAHGRVLVEIACLVAIRGDLPEAAPHDGAFARQDLVHGADVARREVVRVLRGHVQVLARELERRTHRF